MKKAVFQHRPGMPNNFALKKRDCIRFRMQSFCAQACLTRDKCFKFSRPGPGVIVVVPPPGLVVVPVPVPVPFPESVVVPSPVPLSDSDSCGRHVQ